MTLTELKKGIVGMSLPNRFIAIGKSYNLLTYYLDQISLTYNRKIKKVFDLDSALAINTDFDIDYTLYVLFLNKKDIERVCQLVTSEAMLVFIVDEEISSKLPQVEVGKISHKASLVYLLSKVEIKDKAGKGTNTYYLSDSLIDEALLYFDDDLDRVVNEISKVEVLGLSTPNSWDKPFSALLGCLPPKDSKLRSLKWFSGGDVDTCQVLYNIYIKKLRGLPDQPIEDQKIWAKLVKESIWCEACIVSGLIGDYVSDYLRLVENSLPGDFKVEYFPPVFFNQILNSPEWGVNINKVLEEN